MNSSPLEALVSEAFQDSIGFEPPPKALRRLLQRHRFVRQANAAVRRGQVGERDVRTFAARLASEHRAGVRLPGDVALAALAVALESCREEFAEEYLCDLSRLSLPELTAAIHVARR